MAASRDESVFLNVPYSKGYEQVFLALIAGLVSLGRVPRCALELAERGRGRMDRIFQLIEKCGFSIHDLSRVGLPAKFNVPFELGLACAAARYRGNHDFVMLERVEGRLLNTLGDLAGHDHFIHEGKPRLMLSRLLDILGRPGFDPALSEQYELYRDLSQAADSLRQEHGAKTIFTPHIYRQLVEAATQLAQAQGWLDN